MLKRSECSSKDYSEIRTCGWCMPRKLEAQINQRDVSLPRYPHLYQTARVHELLHKTKGYSSVKRFSAITLCWTFSLLLKGCLSSCACCWSSDVCWAEPTQRSRVDGEGLLGSVSEDLEQCVKTYNLAHLVFLIAMRLWSVLRKFRTERGDLFMVWKLVLG